MATADVLFVNAGQIATLRGPGRPRRSKELSQLSVVRNGAIAVRDGRILDVGSSRALRARHRAARTIDVEGRCIVPGFVDAHTHLPFAGTRSFELELKLAGKSYLEILKAGGGIHRTVRDTRKASLPSLVRLLHERLRTMLGWGTTTVEAKSGYGLNVRDEVKQLHALARAARQQEIDIIPTFLGAHALPVEHAADRDRYVDLVVGLLPDIAKKGLAEFCDVFCEDGAFTLAESARILEAARRAGLKTKLHADEFTDSGGAALAAKIGCTSAEHLLSVSKKGIRALAASQTVGVLLPGVTVTSFLDRFAPAREMVDAGCAVALGTDFNPNCHVLTMPPVLQWAVYHLRLTPAEALSAATINAAYAVGRGATVGSLEKGKLADFIVMKREDPVDLVYRLGTNPCWMVVKKGEVHGPVPLPSKPRSHAGQ